MIASAGLAKAQRAMVAAKQYGEANAGELTHVSMCPPVFNVDPEVFTNSDEPSTGKKLFIVISSDKGLCGGIHSSVTKATRRAFTGHEDSPIKAQIDPESPVMIVGDKAKAQLSRVHASNIRLTFNQIGRDVPTFADAAGVADLILTSGVEYDSVVLVYNKFVSAISYEAAALEIKGEKALAASENFKVYEMEDDFTKDLAQFSLANAIYSALVEGHASEISARRNAMDNASKNATDMIGSLQMQYNRGRQAAITNELVDIITGTSPCGGFLVFLFMSVQVRVLCERSGSSGMSFSLHSYQSTSCSISVEYRRRNG